MNLRELKDSLSQVINGSISSFGLASLAQKLNCNIMGEVDISRQRRLVQRDLLRHIVREDDSDKFKVLLQETDP